ncbi:MAG: chemotaxis response regulator protein-glutamate methylesterase [Cyanothece sp. SIO1E1]|nr:chemotaxis response regulator protein-glutamate methylesterase [Cyanothece sp. SIO1E1]
MPKIRVLIVDDSVVVRQLMNKVLSRDPALEVVGVAANGRIALAKIAQINPDLIILDLEMPEMGGLETLEAIRQQYSRLPVIIFSAVTELGAAATLEALARGATDYATKPASTSKEEAIQYIQAQLIPKIKVFCPDVLSQPTPESKMSQRRASHRPRGGIAPLITPLRERGDRPPAEIIAIGVSTGGPNALAALLPQFPVDLPVPIVIVQHMPPIFTQRLAESLSAQCQIPVVEGATGDQLRPGQAWIAPGDFHMVVERDGTNVYIRTHQAPPENSCRPAVDVLFRSVVKTYGAGTLGIILTGMGQDGLHGCQCIHEAEGQILAQDESSSVVWGMPGMVANAGLADQILPLNQLAAAIMQRINRGP